MIDDLIKKLISLAKKKWGTAHSIFILKDGSYKCEKCKIVFVAWQKEKILEDECLFWKIKLKNLI